MKLSFEGESDEVETMYREFVDYYHLEKENGYFD